VTITILVVLLVALLATWVTFTATRVDRLHGRVDTARSALETQLVRRAAAAQALVDRAGDRIDPELAARLRLAARVALTAEDGVREGAENDLARALQELPPDLPPDLLQDLTDATTRVLLARRFYNDGVRDTQALRRQLLPRLFRLGGRRPVPGFFEIDEVTLGSPVRADPSR
jgi:hypothetical protein